MPDIQIVTNPNVADRRNAMKQLTEEAGIEGWEARMYFKAMVKDPQSFPKEILVRIERQVQDHGISEDRIAELADMYWGF